MRPLKMCTGGIVKTQSQSYLRYFNLKQRMTDEGTTRTTSGSNGKAITYHSRGGAIFGSRAQDSTKPDVSEGTQPPAHTGKEDRKVGSV